MRKIAKRIVKLASMKKNAVPGDKLYWAYGSAKIRVSWADLRIFSVLEFYPGSNMSCSIEENLPREITYPISNAGGSYIFNIDIEECEVIAQNEEDARKMFINAINDKEKWSFDFQLGDNLDNIVDINSTVDEVEEAKLDNIKFVEDY